MVSFVNESHSTLVSGTSPTLSEPASVRQSDFYLALAIVDNVSTVLTQPAGWTVLYSGASFTPSFKYNVSYIVRGSAAPALGWTITGTAYREVHIFAFRGVHTSQPIDSSVNGGNASVTINPDPPSNTVINSDAMSVALGVSWAGSTSAWAHAAYTIRSVNTAGVDAIAASRLLTVPGAENPAAFTGGSGGGTDCWSATVALKQAPVIRGAFVGNQANARASLF